MKKATIRITVTSPVKPDLVFSMIYAKLMKQYDNALQGNKTKLDDDIAEAMYKGNIVVEADFDMRIVNLNMKGTEEEIEQWTKISLWEKIRRKGFKKLISIEVVR